MAEDASSSGDGYLEARDDISLRDLFPLYSTNLFDSDIGRGLVPIRRHWPESLIRRLAAAVISNNLGIGMDYTLKRYLNSVQYELSDGNRLDEQVENICSSITQTIEELYKFPKTDDAPHQDFFGYFALRKALSGANTAHELAQQGRLAECAVVSRLVLETACWASATSFAADAEDPLAITTTKAISIVKRRHPMAGRLYGALSKFAHWHPDTHLHHLMSDSDGALILERSVGHKVSALVLVLAIFDLISSAFLDHMQHHYPDRDTGPLKEARPELTRLSLEIVKVANGKLRNHNALADFIVAWSP